MKYFKENSGRKRIATSELIKANKMYPGKFDFDIADSIEISEEEFISLNNDLTFGNAAVKLNARGCYTGLEITEILKSKIKPDWHTRYKAMKSALNWTNADIAEITGKPETSVRQQTIPSHKSGFPMWAKVMVIMWERLAKPTKTPASEA